MKQEKYWSPLHLLPYQRHFNFVNSVRSAGKTYGTQKFFISRAINRGEQFVYIARTKSDVDNGIFGRAFEKVVEKEFPEYTFEFTNDTAFIKNEKTEERKLIGYCLAISQSNKIKNTSYPKVYWLMFDEYCIEETSPQRYIKGFREPELLLNIYHTVDREENRVTCFLLANNISFYNPYHIHPAFRIQPVEVGHIWKSKNVLFENYQISEELAKEKSENLFLNMVKDTDYGSVAVDGHYIYDTPDHVAPLPKQVSYFCTLVCEGQEFGLYYQAGLQNVYISDKVEKTCKLSYACTNNDLAKACYLLAGKKPFVVNYILKSYRNGHLFYTSVEVKKLAGCLFKYIK